MSVEKQTLRKVINSVSPVGKVAITIKPTPARTKINSWNYNKEVPTGTAVLIVQVHNQNYVKVIWDEQVHFLDTNHLRLVEINNAFDGKSFVITGELSAPREYFKNLIKLKGGNFKSTVSKNLDYLVYGKPTRSAKSTKLQKAQKFGIKVISEQEFFRLIAEA